MQQQTKLAVATAIAGGYVLGRTKNGRLALTVAAVVAGRGLGRGPRELAAEGARRLGEAPKVAELGDQFRDQGVEAARNALSAVTDRGMGSLADAIGGRATALGEKGLKPDAEDAEDAEGAEDDESLKQEEEEEEEEEEEGEGAEEEEPPAAKRRRPTRATGTRPGPKKKAPAKKKAAPSKRAGKETASSRSSRRR
ncbi:hypothetical protein [Streptomyces sp. NBC_01716]|uniref:hypothetical protein n=1 Tax=Streptomyces sp. NBC_01716 TaxID=2975917 RepID=UPI002E33EE9E|nr:hypothetical protein [Streptomyces sp. NBC_01716]